MQKVNHKLDRIVQVLLVLGMVFILLYNIPLVEKVNLSYQGVEWQLGNQYYSKDVSVKMNGKYYNYLLRNDDYYKGTLIVKDYLENEIINSELTLELNDSEAKIKEAKPYGENDEKIASGLLWKGNFKTLVFKVYDVLDFGDSSMMGTAWNNSNGMLITAPAADRNSAVAVTHKVQKDIDEDLTVN